MTATEWSFEVRHGSQPRWILVATLPAKSGREALRWCRANWPGWMKTRTWRIVPEGTA